MNVRHFGFIWNSFPSNKLCFFDLTILKIENDDGCQPITGTAVKGRAGGSGKHSLTLSSKCANERIKGQLLSSAEGFDGYTGLLSGATTGFIDFLSYF